MFDEKKSGFKDAFTSGEEARPIESEPDTADYRDYTETIELDPEPKKET